MTGKRVKALNVGLMEAATKANIMMGRSMAWDHSLGLMELPIMESGS